jgi:hypothetical protein
MPDGPVSARGETTWGSEASARNSERLQRIMKDLPLPAGFIVVRMDNWRSPFRQPIRAVRGAEVCSSAK